MPSTPFIAQHPDTPDGSCPDAELLAAYIDGRVTAVERREMEAHLARCESCHFVFAETFQERQTAAAKPNRTAWMAAGLGGLAIAATLGIAVYLGRDSSPQPQSIVVALNELQAAAGPYRTFEGRLSGDNPYRPLAAPVRSGAATGEVPLAVREAALKVELAAQGGTADERRARAIMFLTTQEPVRAAEVLGPVVHSESDPRLLNDAAVALLATGSRADAARARGFLEQVVKREPNFAEAWFNLGLAAGETGDAARSRTAWVRFLALDSSSPWATEARSRLEKLPRPAH